MIGKGDLAIDPRGLIYEAYRIDGITEQDCRVIFLDWAMSSPQDDDMHAMLSAMLAHYGAANPDHPMTRLIADGLRHPVGSGRRRRR